jgi:hypothetical protein
MGTSIVTGIRGDADQAPAWGAPGGKKFGSDIDRFKGCEDRKKGKKFTLLFKGLKICKGLKKGSTRRRPGADEAAWQLRYFFKPYVIPFEDYEWLSGAAGCSLMVQ